MSWPLRIERPKAVSQERSSLLPDHIEEAKVIRCLCSQQYRRCPLAANRCPKLAASFLLCNALTKPFIAHRSPLFVRRIRPASVKSSLSDFQATMMAEEEPPSSSAVLKAKISRCAIAVRADRSSLDVCRSVVLTCLALLLL